ncbi:MAG: methylated-DNA--[protein]-cysteine S-methyltransferase [Proteobacteria bacterium]|nr:methylated-DNA--[protein]-cysteine S-methyltransferase [Pseudomonadota bacterium]
MITEVQKQEFYQALLDKNIHYEGIFFVGVQTTCVFCRPTCPAQKPKFENFSKIMGALPTKFDQHNKILKVSWIDTKLGPMIAIADEAGLYLLEFVDRRDLEREVERLRLRTKAAIIPGTTDPIKSITLELESYFEGKLKEFNTPLHLLGSPFQKLVWDELMRIPYGTTRSYMVQATSIGKNKAYRAVANANAANQLAIIIPCHRIINSNGDLGGYGGGITRKQWLLEHETSHV